MVTKHEIPAKDLIGLIEFTKYLKKKHITKDMKTLEGKPITLLILFNILYGAGLAVSLHGTSLGEADLEIKVRGFDKDEAYPLTKLRLCVLNQDIGKRYSVAVNKECLRNTLGFVVTDDEWEKWLCSNRYYNMWEEWAISGFTPELTPYTVLPHGYLLENTKLTTYGEL